MIRSASETCKRCGDCLETYEVYQGKYLGNRYETRCANPDCVTRKRKYFGKSSTIFKGKTITVRGEK